MEFGYDDELENDNLYYEEPKQYETPDLKEALGAIGQDGSVLKLLGIFVWTIPLIFLLFVSYLYADVNVFKSPGILAGFLLLSTIVSVSYWVITGYYSLYAHDRALDKNAKLRDWSTCAMDALMVGIKKAFGMWLLSLSMIGLGLLSLIVIIPLAMKVPILAIILAVIVYVSLLITWLVLYFKLYPFFLVDFKISAWVNWKKAFDLSKDIHYGKLNILLAVLFDIAVSIPFIIVSFIVMFFIGGVSAFIHPSHNVNNFAIFLIMSILILLYFIAGFIITVFWKNFFGQYTYNALKINRRISPEKLSRVINKDKLPAIIAAIVLLLLNLLSTLSNLAKTQRFEAQKDRMATVVMMKSITNYESIAEIYMLENDTTTVQNMFGANCENAQEYFKIAQSYNSCNFVTADGVYWQLDPRTGGATISDNATKPNITLKVGVCYGGQLNCAYEFPETRKFIDENGGGSGLNRSTGYGGFGFKKGLKK